MGSMQNSSNVPPGLGNNTSNGQRLLIRPAAFVNRQQFPQQIFHQNNQIQRLPQGQVLRFRTPPPLNYHQPTNQQNVTQYHHSQQTSSSNVTRPAVLTVRHPAISYEAAHQRLVVMNQYRPSINSAIPTQKAQQNLQVIPIYPRNPHQPMTNLYTLPLGHPQQVPTPTAILSPPIDTSDSARFTETPMVMPLECELGENTPESPATSPELAEEQKFFDTSELLREQLIGVDNNLDESDPSDSKYISSGFREKSPAKRIRRTKQEIIAARNAELMAKIKPCGVVLERVVVEKSIRLFKNGQNMVWKSNCPMIPSRMKITSTHVIKIVTMGFNKTKKGFLYSCMSSAEIHDGFQCKFKSYNSETFVQHLQNHHMTDKNELKSCCNICKQNLCSASAIDEFRHMTLHIVREGNSVAEKQIFYSEIKPLEVVISSHANREIEEVIQNIPIDDNCDLEFDDFFEESDHSDTIGSISQAESTVKTETKDLQIEKSKETPKQPSKQKSERNSSQNGQNLMTRLRRASVLLENFVLQQSSDENSSDDEPLIKRANRKRKFKESSLKTPWKSITANDGIKIKLRKIDKGETSSEKSEEKKLEVDKNEKQQRFDEIISRECRVVLERIDLSNYEISDVIEHPDEDKTDEGQQRTNNELEQDAPKRLPMRFNSIEFLKNSQIPNEDEMSHNEQGSNHSDSGCEGSTKIIPRSSRSSSKDFQSDEDVFNDSCACSEDGSVEKVPHLEESEVVMKDLISLYPWYDDDDLKGMWFKSEKSYKNLLTVESLVANFKCMSQQCSFYCDEIKDFESHLESHHGDAKFHVCSHCLADYRQYSGLIEHLKNFHTKNIYQCTKCMYRACDKVYLEIHRKQFHSKSCTILMTSEEFQIEKGLEAEQTKKFTSAIPRKCKFCPKTLIFAEDYGKHLQAKLKMNRYDSIEPEIFHEIMEIIEMLKVDIIKKDDEDDYDCQFRKFRCLYCDDAFHELDNIKTHLAENHKDDPAVVGHVDEKEKNAEIMNLSSSDVPVKTYSKSSFLHISSVRSLSPK